LDDLLKSSNMPCWPLPGVVGVADNLFPRTVYFFVITNAQDKLYFLRTSRGDRTIAICRHL